MLIALTRAVPPSIHRCELTHLARTPIDYARAVHEHELYERCLQEMGCRVERLPDAPELPDSVFVEDTAVVFDELAVVARPGAASRRAEVAPVADVLRRYRTLAYIQPPATLDGGDVLVTASDVFVGVSGRTNADGARQLASLIIGGDPCTPPGSSLAGAPPPRSALRVGRRVIPVPVSGCLHLKSAVTAVSDTQLLINPDWVDRDVFEGFECIEIDPSEPYAANVLRIRNRTLCAAEFPQTRKRLEANGIPTMAVSAGELANAEGGLTCGCLILTVSS